MTTATGYLEASRHPCRPAVSSFVFSSFYITHLEFMYIPNRLEELISSEGRRKADRCSRRDQRQGTTRDGSNAHMLRCFRLSCGQRRSDRLDCRGCAGSFRSQTVAVVCCCARSNQRPILTGTCAERLHDHQASQVVVMPFYATLALSLRKHCRLRRRLLHRQPRSTAAIEWLDPTL